jgi:hypothetical protein
MGLLDAPRRIIPGDVFFADAPKSRERDSPRDPRLPGGPSRNASVRYGTVTEVDGIRSGFRVKQKDPTRCRQSPPNTKAPRLEWWPILVFGHLTVNSGGATTPHRQPRRCPVSKNVWYILGL